MPATFVLGFRHGLRRASDASAVKAGSALGIIAGLAICLLLALT